MRAARYFLDKTLSLLWVIFAIGSLYQLNLSLFLLLTYSAVVKDDPQRVLPLALSELSKVFFEGFFFFGKVFRPGARTMLPDKKTRSNEIETIKVGLDFIFVKLLGILAGNTALIVIGADLSNQRVYILSLVLALPCGVFRLAKWSQRRLAQHKEYDKLEDMSLASQAIKKVRERLSPTEQNELALLLYQSHELSRRTAINLVKFVCGSLMVSLIVSVVQELIERIPK